MEVFFIFFKQRERIRKGESVRETFLFGSDMLFCIKAKNEPEVEHKYRLTYRFLIFSVCQKQTFFYSG